MKNNEYNLRHKTNFLRKTICILILGAFLNSFVFSWYQVETNYTYISDPVASVSHSPISIDGNAALDAFCSGKGTDGLSWDTAHVIEDLEIDAGGVGCGIDIRNTDRFLIISNCIIINSGNERYKVAVDSYKFGDSGIFLDSVKNVKITECDVNNNYYGIALLDGSYNIISDNIVSNNRRGGIGTDNSNYNIISDNKAMNDSNAGIYLSWFSNYNTISGNIVLHNGEHGIWLVFDCCNNIISGNNASHNGDFGIKFNYADNNTLSGNNASYNDLYGIFLADSVNNTLSGNYASYNSQYGIALNDDSDNNEVYQNIVCYNEQGNINDLGNDNDIHDNDYCTGAATDGVIPGYPFVWMLGLILFGLTVSLYVVLKRRKNNH